jgi:hypothetical protein
MMNQQPNEPEIQVTLPATQAQAILDYLGTKPYNEVAMLIGFIQIGAKDLSKVTRLPQKGEADKGNESA